LLPVHSAAFPACLAVYRRAVRSGGTEMMDPADDMEAAVQQASTQLIQHINNI